MRKADNLPPYRAVVMKSGSLNFLEPSGPAQACYGRALLYFFTFYLYSYVFNFTLSLHCFQLMRVQVTKYCIT